METTVTIEKLVYGGYGLARTANGVVFVTDALPGERVVIEETGKRSDCVLARVVEILSPSPERRKSPCPLAGICGGCDWLHIAAAAQPGFKRDIVVDCMRRIGRIVSPPKIELIAGEEFAYRHRAQIKVDEKGNAGFFTRGTNDIVAVPRCPLLSEPLNELLTAFAEKELVLPISAQNFLLMAGDGGTVASSPVIAGRTSTSVIVTAGLHTFEVAATDFFQSNRLLLERLGDWAANLVKGDRCIDCYGGSGFFSVMLADRFSRGILLESSPSLVERAKANFARNGILHFDARAAAAESLAQVMQAFSPDCLIVDPPRPGLSHVVREAIADYRPATVLYVSCNPSTQARDVGFLVAKAGYLIEHAAVIDLYPNTHHCESLLVLTKV